MILLWLTLYEEDTIVDEKYDDASSSFIKASKTIDRSYMLIKSRFMQHRKISHSRKRALEWAEKILIVGKLLICLRKPAKRQTMSSRKQKIVRMR